MKTVHGLCALAIELGVVLISVAPAGEVMTLTLSADAAAPLGRAEATL